MTVIDMLQLRALYPPLNAQAGLKILAVVRESRSHGSMKRVLTTSGAIVTRKPFLQLRYCAASRARPWKQAPSRNRQKTRPSSGLGVGVASESRRPKTV